GPDASPGDLRQLHTDGFVLEGGLGARLDHDRDRIRVACTRARELRGGRTTGPLYADVELLGSLTAPLSALAAIAATPATFLPPPPPRRPLPRLALDPRAAPAPPRPGPRLAEPRVIPQQDLVQQLARRGLGAWSVIERVQDLAFAADHPARQRRDHR